MNDQQNQSIHPGVVNGRRVFPLVNTAMPRRKGISAKKLANMKKHYEQHPHDAATGKRLSENAK